MYMCGYIICTMIKNVHCGLWAFALHYELQKTSPESTTFKLFSKLN